MASCATPSDAMRSDEIRQLVSKSLHHCVMLDSQIVVEDTMTRRFNRKRTRASLNGMANSVRPQPLLAVRDVRASAVWYATLLGATRTSELMASDHDYLYDRLLVDGALVLQLHAWDAEDHSNLVDPDSGRNGHGVLVWFELDELDAAVDRARALRAQIVEDVHTNPAPRHREIWLRDPDGYLVVLCSPDGEATED